MAVDWKVIHFSFGSKKEAEQSAKKKRDVGYKTKIVKLASGYVVHYGR